jgi:fumarate hydratase subunit beta
MEESNMTKIKRITAPLSTEVCEALRTGDIVLLTGDIYTGRDVAHRRLFDAVLAGEKLPIDLENEIMFYAAPTPARAGQITGSIGPTTSYRMDPYTPRLLERGLKGMIGKGKRSPEVIEALKKYKAVYFGAMGGVAALMAKCVRTARVVAYDDLGPEAIMRLTVSDLPLVVVNDTKGRDLFGKAIKQHRK